MLNDWLNNESLHTKKNALPYENWGEKNGMRKNKELFQ